MKDLQRDKNNLEHLPFVLPDLDTTSQEKEEIPLGSGYITSLLGKGGMANVYEIWNPNLEVHRAVKLIHPSASEIDRERFDTEIRITAKLHHPFITEIHGVGKWNGLSYLEMEKIEGVTLKDLIRERGALPLPVCTALGIMISEALEYAHNQEYMIYGKEYHGIIHRDLKPSNIMLCEDGSVKLMDFGIARPTDASFHTIDGTFVGTIHYLPPEQLKGELIDIRTDIYSLASTLYEILTGFKAFPQYNVSKLIIEKTKNHFRPLSEYKIKIPKAMRTLIRRCMHSNPQKRYSNAKMLHQKLVAIHKNITSDTPQDVIKKAVNTRSYEKITISTRNHYIRNLSIAAGILIAIGISSKIVIQFMNSHQIENNSEKLSDQNIKTVGKKTELGVLESENQKAAIPKRVTQLKPKPVISTPIIQDEEKGKALKAEEQQETDLATVNDTVTINAAPYDGELLLENMAKYYKVNDYSNILATFDQLQEEDKKVTAKLYKLRALEGLKDLPKLKTFFNKQIINDGEFFLAKAKLAFSENKISEAKKYLDTSLRTPCSMLNRKNLKQEVYYYTALCATKKFDADPSEENYKATLGTWHQLKAEVKANPNNYYFKRAIDEMQRIGNKYRNNKG